MSEIICGDCLKVMKGIEDNSIDCIVTSPPYNKKGLAGDRKIGNNLWKGFRIDYDEYADNMDEVEYQNWQIEVLNECYRILNPEGSMFYNHKIRRFNNKAYFPTWVFNSNFQLYQMSVWDRGNCCDMRDDYLYPTTELIFWLAKDKPKCFKNQAVFKNEICKMTPTKAEGHCATYPIELATNCILLATKEGDTVLDPFVGSGTTAVAAKQLNREYVGIDISQHYCDMAKAKIEETLW